MVRVNMAHIYQPGVPQNLIDFLFPEVSSHLEVSTLSGVQEDVTPVWNLD
jgi:hypothetical protein